MIRKGGAFFAPLLSENLTSFQLGLMLVLVLCSLEKPFGVNAALLHVPP